MMARKYWYGTLLATLSWLAAFPTSANITDAQRLDQAFTRSSLQIATPDARLHTFKVWVADSEQRRARGLMFVTHMEPDTGMLFIYPGQQRISMWMKNTHIPLDMLFVGADGRVVKVVPNTRPMSVETIESGKEVRAVIELNAGTAARLHIGPGAQVSHPAFDRR